MSHLNFMEKLLDGMGGEWIPLGKVAKKIYSGGTPSTKNTEYWEGGTIPWMSSGEVNLKVIEKTEQYISEAGFKNSSAKIVPKNSIVMALAGQGKTRGKVARTRIELTTNQSLAAITFDEEKISCDYLYHFLDSQYENLRQISSGNSGRGGLNLKMISSYKVPIPCPDNPEKSLAIQAEIVRILDAFTAMTAELTAELNMRKKQYNYYRDQLLSFEEGEVEWKTLEEVAHFANGKGHEKVISEDGKFIVVNSKFISTDGLIAKYSDSQICPLFKDDILLVMSDLPNGKALSKTFIVDEDERYTLNQRIGGITVKDKSEILPKFLHYFLDRTPQLLKHNNGVDQTNLRKGQILEVKVPILPLHKQEHIVSILDKFDKLTKSLSEGLPREIELRQKQYEYYRDLLLSFPKSDEAA